MRQGKLFMTCLSVPIRELTTLLTKTSATQTVPGGRPKVQTVAGEQGTSGPGPVPYI